MADVSGKRELEDGMAEEPQAKRMCPEDYDGNDDGMPGYVVFLRNPSALKSMLECMVGQTIALSCENGNFVMSSATQGGAAAARFVMTNENAEVKGDNASFSVDKSALKSGLQSCMETLKSKNVPDATTILTLKDGTMTIEADAGDVCYKNELTWATPISEPPEEDGTKVAIDMTMANFKAGIKCACARPDVTTVSIDLGKDRLVFEASSDVDSNSYAMKVRNPDAEVSANLNAKMLKIVQKIPSATTMIQLQFYPDSAVVFMANTGDGFIQITLSIYHDSDQEVYL